MLLQKILKMTFSKLAEIDFPGIKFTKKSTVRNWLDLAGSSRFHHMLVRLLKNA